MKNGGWADGFGLGITPFMGIKIEPKIRLLGLGMRKAPIVMDRCLACDGTALFRNAFNCTGVLLTLGTVIDTNQKDFSVVTGKNCRIMMILDLRYC